MPTFNQIARKPRKARRYKDKRIAIAKCPQKKGTCLKITEMTPRKPNSAIRKVSRIMLTNWRRIWGYIPGFHHNLQKHSTVLIRGGRVKDLPGMKYTIIRGVYDTHPWITRYTARSKYGVSIQQTRVMKWSWPYFRQRVY